MYPNFAKKNREGDPIKFTRPQGARVLGTRLGKKLRRVRGAAVIFVHASWCRHVIAVNLPGHAGTPKTHTRIAPAGGDAGGGFLRRGHPGRGEAGALALRDRQLRPQLIRPGRPDLHHEPGLDAVRVLPPFFVLAPFAGGCVSDGAHGTPRFVSGVSTHKAAASSSDFLVKLYDYNAQNGSLSYTHTLKGTRANRACRVPTLPCPMAPRLEMHTTDARTGHTDTVHDIQFSKFHPHILTTASEDGSTVPTLVLTSPPLGLRHQMVQSRRCAGTYVRDSRRTYTKVPPPPPPP